MSTWDNFLASSDGGGWAGVGAPAAQVPMSQHKTVAGTQLEQSVAERQANYASGGSLYQQAVAEEKAMRDAVAAIRAQMEGGGGSVSAAPNTVAPAAPQTGGPDPFAGLQTGTPPANNFTHGGVPLRNPNETVGTGGPDPHPGARTGGPDPYPTGGARPGGMSNKQALMQRDWNDAFNSFAPGTTVPFGDGSITFAQGGNAVYTGKDGKAYNFNRNMSLQEVASAAPGIAAVWKQQYGFNPTGELQQSGNGYLMDEWYNHQYPFLRDNLNLATSGAVQAGNTMLGSAKDMYDDYEKTFRPTYGKLADFVNQMGDEGHRSTMRGQAMEGVQSQFDLQDAALRRKFQGMGAGSGAMADAMAGQSAGRALAKVKAATDSDNNLRSMYGNGLSGMASLGLNVNQAAGTNANNALGAFGKPLTWGTDLAKTGAGLQSVDTTSKLGLGDLAIKDYTARQNSGVNWFNAESNRIQANNGTTNANTAAQAQSEASNPTNTILGGLAAGGLKWALSS